MNYMSPEQLISIVERATEEVDLTEWNKVIEVKLKNRA